MTYTKDKNNMSRRSRRIGMRNEYMFAIYIMAAIIFILAAVLISTRSRSSVSYPGYMMNGNAFRMINPDMSNYMYRIAPDGSILRGN